MSRRIIISNEFKIRESIQYPRYERIKNINFEGNWLTILSDWGFTYHVSKQLRYIMFYLYQVKLIYQYPSIPFTLLWIKNNIQTWFKTISNRLSISGKTRQLHASHLTTYDRLWSNLPYMRPLATVIGDSLNRYGIDEDGGSVHDVIGKPINWLVFENVCDCRVIILLKIQIFLPESGNTVTTDKTASHSYHSQHNNNYTSC